MKKIISAFFYSVSGLKSLLKERAFREEIILFFVCAIPMFLLDLSTTKKLYIFSAMCVVLITEALNSAIETTIDRISNEKHELSKKAKDTASAAVFIALIHFAIAYITLIFF